MLVYMAKTLRSRLRILFRVAISVLVTRTTTVGPTPAVAFRQGSSLRFPFIHGNPGLSTAIAPHLQPSLASGAPLPSIFGTLVTTKCGLSGKHVFAAGEEQEKEQRVDARLRDAGRSPSSLNGDERTVSPVSIKVIGVGGGGVNAVDGMISTATRKLPGVEFMAMNTDTQALANSLAEVKVTLGREVTRGLGAGGKPEVGKAAAIESLKEIESALVGADMVFVTAGMGGGTGTGAAPVIVSVARELGCVTVAIVTEPFRFEGMQRGRQAAAGLEELRSCADTVLVVANDRLTDIVPNKMTMTNAFLVADDVLRQGVIGTSEIIVRPGLMNVDFADVRAILKDSGTGLIGVGTGTGKTRAEDAAVGAICSPLLDFPVDEARGVIFNIVGGLDMSLSEVNAAARIIHNNVHPDANIIVGALVDEQCGQQVSVTVVATSFPMRQTRGVKSATVRTSPAIERPQLKAEVGSSMARSLSLPPSGPDDSGSRGRRLGWEQREGGDPVPTEVEPSTRTGVASNAHSGAKRKLSLLRRILGLP